MWIYIETESRVFTTGFYDPKGDFQGDKDFGNRDDAAKRCNLLNGGPQFPAMTTDALQGINEALKAIANQVEDLVRV